jgi:hypothetical protein
MEDLIYWANVPTEVKKLKLAMPSKAATILNIAVSDLPAVVATFADLAAARTSVVAQNVAIESRLDAIEVKINEIITKLKTAGIITV